MRRLGPTLPAACLLSILILFQSCTAYKGSLTLEQAVLDRKKVKVTTTQVEKPYQFEYIENREGKYVGIPARYKDYGEVTLDASKIVEIKEHDKTASTLLTFTPIAILVGLGVVLFTSAD